MIRVSRRFVFLAVLLASLPAMAEKKKINDLLLSGEFPPIDESQKTLAEVPFAKGAPAAVLLAARQCEWTWLDNDLMLRMHEVRRVKILTEAGVKSDGDLSFDLYGSWRVKKVEARTVLPDGTVVDASGGVHRERSEAGVEAIRVAFPRVQVGAILDFRIETNADAASVSPWYIQERIPVVQSRLVLMPPKGLKYRMIPLRLTDEQAKPESYSTSMGKVFVWSFESVPPLPDEANIPPRSEVAEGLLAFPIEYRGEGTVVFATDWRSFCEQRKLSWEDWLSRSHGNAATLAKQVTNGKNDPVQKAEAIRRELLQRIRVEALDDSPRDSSPDEVLAKGKGTSADAAGVAVAMLRAAGVDATLAAIRRRSNGGMAIDTPVPVFFDDLLVRIPGEKGPVFFSPASRIAVGGLPWDCRGVLAAPFESKVEQPTSIPDFKSSENRTLRTANVTVDATGLLRGDAQLVYQGIAAEPWRARLADLDTDRRKEAVRESLRRFMPGAQVTSLEIVDLDDESKDLTVKVAWEAEGYASLGGKRLLLNPNLFARTDAEAWAPADRKLPVDLRAAYEQLDTVTIRLPEGVRDVTVPPPAAMNAGPVGAYQETFDRGQGTVTVKRNMRLDVYFFPDLRSYAGLRRWFQAIASADDRPLVLTLP